MDESSEDNYSIIGDEDEDEEFLDLECQKTAPLDNGLSLYPLLSRSPKDNRSLF